MGILERVDEVDEEVVLELQMVVDVLDEVDALDNEIVEELDDYKIIVGLDDGDEVDIRELDAVDIVLDIDDLDILVVYRELHNIIVVEGTHREVLQIIVEVEVEERWQVEMLVILM